MSEQQHNNSDMVYDYFKTLRSDVSDKFKVIDEIIVELTKNVTQLSERQITILRVQDQYAESQKQLSEEFKTINGRMLRIITKVDSDNKDMLVLRKKLKEANIVIKKIYTLITKYNSDSGNLKHDISVLATNLRKTSELVETINTERIASKNALQFSKHIIAIVIGVISFISLLIGIWSALKPISG